MWDPYTQKNINQLEMVQRRAARFVFKTYLRHVSVTALIKELGWSELSSARKRDRLCMMFKIVNLIPINFNDHLSYCTPVTRRNHPQKLNILAPRTDTYKFSFFPRTIPEWNSLPAFVRRVAWSFFQVRTSTYDLET